jgi:DNA polymerase III alpha subunit (gram-positive type)
MSMATPVKLKDIIEGMEFQSDEGSSHLNTTTSEVIYITDEKVRAAEDETPLEQFPEWQHEAIRVAKGFLESADYLPLPTKFDIHEYHIMERFCYSVDDDEMRDDLFNAIRGSDAFRRFKDRIHDCWTNQALRYFSTHCWA